MPTVAVRAKFTVMSVTKIARLGKEITAEEVEMVPVCSPDTDSGNGKWSRGRPSGNIRLYITNPGAFDKFGPGAEYYVDFTPAE